MEREASARLQRMIRFDTTNPPGNEMPLAKHLAVELEEEEFSPQVFESMEERGSLAVAAGRRPVHSARFFYFPTWMSYRQNRRVGFIRLSAA